MRVIPTQKLSIILERAPIESRWATHRWDLLGVVPDQGGEARTSVESATAMQRLHPGFDVALYRDEAEGYYLNVSGPAPSVFILWRMDEDRAVPVEVTVSSEEAGRWLDGGHSVDRVGMPPEIFAWVGDYVEHNYRPQPQKRIKPRSFKHPKDRV